MTAFDSIAIVDWSARSSPSPAKPSADAIWVAVADGTTKSRYHPTRAEATEALIRLAQSHVAAGKRLLIGVDFPLGYPRGTAQALSGSANIFDLWALLSAHIEDGDDNSNNRFEVANALNARLPGIGPFWGCPNNVSLPELPAKGTDRRDAGLPEKRKVEDLMPSAQTVWKLYTTGSVGSQSLLGIPRMAAVRAALGQDLAVWPFEAPDAPVVLAEIYPSLLATEVDQALRQTPERIKDDVQVQTLASALFNLNQSGVLAEAFAAAPDAALEEGWILGVGAEAALRKAARPDLKPPRLSNDCFALPSGVDWVPVAEALARLQDGLVPVVGSKSRRVAKCAGRILATDAIARRSNPPGANSAVDGYGFSHAALSTGPQVVPLMDGRAAAGAPYREVVPAGSAIRILTGALVPKGVDTVVLQEDVSIQDGYLAFDNTLRAGANCRKAGEDVEQGQVVLPAGRQITEADLALATATGLDRLEVRKRLRVGVLSTGDELASPAGPADPSITFDANRPMLLALARRWGHRPVDLGIAADDRDLLRERLNKAARTSDVILTSGGASAGEEDHMSAILREEGTVQTWRIAIKPGRPLALGFWNGVPVIGTPGNPVAAFVCALIFARPALSALAGSGWITPQPLSLPSAFTKRKKPGRTEYLRARLTPQNTVEVFQSEGSGRISGLSWAEGLVHLGPEARDIAPGDPVDYLPFGSFGL